MNPQQSKPYLLAEAQHNQQLLADAQATGDYNAATRICLQLSDIDVVLMGGDPRQGTLSDDWLLLAEMNQLAWQLKTNTLRGSFGSPMVEALRQCTTADQARQVVDDHLEKKRGFIVPTIRQLPALQFILKQLE